MCVRACVCACVCVCARKCSAIPFLYFLHDVHGMQSHMLCQNVQIVITRARKRAG